MKVINIWQAQKNEKKLYFSGDKKMKWLIKGISLLPRLLLLLLFISYSASIMMFYHTHEVKGTLITHSHPYKMPANKGKGENHSHSTSQYLLLQHLCQAAMTDSLLKFVSVPDIVYSFCSEIIPPYSNSFSSIVNLTESLRGPPVCWIFRKTDNQISLLLVATTNY